MTAVMAPCRNQAEAPNIIGEKNTEILRQTHVAAVAAELPAMTAVFERNGIDFCCGGARPLGDVCMERGLDFDVLSKELLAAVEGPGGETRSWVGAPIAELVCHIFQSLPQETPRGPASPGHHE